MRRLSGIDADLLYGETPSVHLNVAVLMVLDPSTSPTPFGLDAWKRILAGHIADLPPLRERLVEVPFGIDRPLWIDDPHFDLARHVRRIAVPAPGGAKELGALVGDLSSYALDRSAPLWEMWWIEGVEKGRVAVLFKVHHACVDGMAGALMLGRTLTAEPTEAADVPAWRPDPGQGVPSPASLFAGGVASALLTPVRALRTVVHTAESVGKLARGWTGSTARHPALPFQAPRTSLNRSVTPHRSFAFVSVPIGDVKAVKNVFGARVNDVALALCSGALRRYLDERGELPKEPLIAAIPVSMRERTGQASVLGNAVSGMFTTLATHLNDPAERLREIQRGTESAKDIYASGIEDAIMEWADLSLPATVGVAGRLWNWMHLSERLPPIFNVLISNVPGPPVPLFAGGAQVVACYPMGPLVENVALNVTVLSYHDQVGFGLLACPEVIPDVWAIANAIPETLAELLARARVPTRRSGRSVRASKGKVRRVRSRTRKV